MTGSLFLTAGFSCCFSNSADSSIPLRIHSAAMTSTMLKMNGMRQPQLRNCSSVVSWLIKETSPVERSRPTPYPTCTPLL